MPIRPKNLFKTLSFIFYDIPVEILQKLFIQEFRGLNDRSANQIAAFPLILRNLQPLSFRKSIILDNLMHGLLHLDVQKHSG